MRLSRFLQYAFIAIVVTTVAFSLYQWNASRAALKVNTNQNLNTNSLIGHWTFDGTDTVWTSSTAGTTLDKSGNGNTGTLTNMNRATSPTIGKIGQALSFDGSTTRVGADSVTASIDVTNFSVSFWEKTTSSVWGTPFSLGSSTDTDPLVQFAVNVAFPGDGMLFCFRDNITSGNPECARDSSTVYKNGEWHHFIGTRLGNVVTIYRDGALIQQVTLTGVGVGPISVNKTTIGTLGRTYDQLFFNGTIDDVRVYNRELSGSEVVDLYQMGGVKENTSALQPQGIGNLNSGLTGYWKFDDGSGSTAADSSGNANTGTLVNTPTWTTGQIDGGIGLLNASAQYVSLGNPSTYDLTSTGQLTISAWVKSGSSIINSTLGILKRGATNTVNAPDQYALTSSNTRWRFMAGNGTTYTEVFGPGGGLAPNTWYHLTGVIDASNISLYVNGTSAATPVARPAGSTPVSASTFIGTIMAGGGTWDGILDEVRIYNRALSSDEISRLYRLTTPTEVDTSLRGYWSLDGKATNWTSGTTGTTADLSSYNNTGTLTNMNRATSPVIGNLGQGMFFTRSSTERVLLGADKKPVLTNDYSIAFWVYPTQSFSEASFVSGYNGYGGPSIGITDDSFFLRFYGEPGDTAISAPKLTPNRWYFITGTRDSVTGVMNLYKDGVLAGTGTKSMGPLPSNLNGRWSFGQTYNIPSGGGVNGCGCRLDEIRIYDRVLSLPEITDLYQTGVKKINTTQNINTNGLVGHWTLDGKDTIWSSSVAGTTLDISGNSNTGTLTSLNRATSPAIGKLGQALDFAGGGSGDYVNFGSAANLDDIETQGGGGMTVMAWINPRSSGGSTNSVIIGKSNSGTAGFWRMNNLGRLSFTKDFSTTDLSTMSNASNPLIYNQWQHVAATWDGSAFASNIHLYINGAEISGYTSQFDGVGTAVSDAANSVYMSASATNEFDGKIDDARIYNRVLSAAEIAALYTSTR